jgi:ubiquinone/menaquinone biosynthesis C-methylase UbiE
VAARRPRGNTRLRAVSPPAPRVDAIAATGFQRAAGDYERGRPGYPAEVVERMRQEIGIQTGQTVVDLAAGTGKLTRRLVELLPAEVIAVEPVAGMRAQLERVVPGVTVLDGTAEQIPLADAAAHVVFVAQAFHWFRVPQAAAEIARVLDADGALAIVRNQEVESATAPAVTAALTLVHEQVRQPRLRHRVWRDELEETKVFEPFHEWTVENAITQDIETFRHRIASRSYVGAMADGQRAQLLNDVQTVLEGHGIAPGEPFAVPTLTRVIWARTRRAR